MRTTDEKATFGRGVDGFRNTRWFCTLRRRGGCQTATTAQGQSLYARLGGYDALVAVTKDFIGRLATDPQLSRFFVELNDASKARVQAHVVDFLCVATGGPCIYTGQDMKTAHTGLHITEADWSASAAHLTETLNKFNVPQKEQSEVMSAISGLKGDIVGR
jgi:hemoglobin